MRNVLVVFSLLLTLFLSIGAQAGSQTDDRKPAPWAAPTQPSPSPCNFVVQTNGDWTVIDEQDKMSFPPIPSPGIDVKTYANAALKGMEIWGYTWSWDGADWDVSNDHIGSYDEAGYHTCMITYTANPASGCSAQYSASFYPQFRWQMGGQGNAELESIGYMYGQLGDITFTDPDAGGKIEKYAGDRAGGHTSGESTIQLQLGGLTITLPLQIGVSNDAVIPLDGGTFAGANDKSDPIPLTSDTLNIRSYVKVRSWVDAPGLYTDGDVQAWVYESDPRLTVFLTCGGSLNCDSATTSQYKRAAQN